MAIYVCPVLVAEPSVAPRDGADTGLDHHSPCHFRPIQSNTYIFHVLYLSFLCLLSIKLRKLLLSREFSSEL